MTNRRTFVVVLVTAYESIFFRINSTSKPFRRSPGRCCLAAFWRRPKECVGRVPFFCFFPLFGLEAIEAFQEVVMAVQTNPTVPNPGVVHVGTSAGEFLVLQLDAGGPRATFVFATDFKGVLLNQDRFPDHPAPTYLWNYLRDPSDIAQFEIATLALAFITNAQYRYRVAIHNSAGPVRRVLDISYQGQISDIQRETFQILVS